MQVPGENSINSSRRLTIYYHCSSRARHAIIWFTAVKGTKELSTKVAIFAPENRYSHGAYLTALSSLLHLFYYGGAYMSRSRCIKKGAKLLENTDQRALARCSGTRYKKVKEMERDMYVYWSGWRDFSAGINVLFFSMAICCVTDGRIVKRERKGKKRKEPNRVRLRYVDVGDQSTKLVTRVSILCIASVERTSAY